MNDAARRQLASHAARIVAGLAARPRRRASMREELLAHLVAASDEERGRHGDAAAATVAAARRLGDPADLSRQLQASVPRLEAALFSLLPRKEDHMSRSLWASGLAAAAIGFLLMLGLSIVMPAAGLVVQQATAAGVDVHAAGNRLEFSLIALVLFSAAVMFGGLGTIGYGALRARRNRRMAA